ncbi:MAG: FAD-binding protein [Defluviicoccus sp.]|nr:FAD-binding protein [Defluviicoccus sp.]
MDGIPRSVERYDETFDVVVVGYGFAGSVSALEAARAGAKVLLIEKTGVPGGISICSYGAVRCAMDEERAYSYLAATNAGRTPDEVVRALAGGMSRLEPYVRGLARVNGAELMTTIETGKTGANYPLPGFDAFYQTVVVSVPNFDARAVYPWANGAPGGPMLFKIIDDNLANEDVEIRLNTRGVRLLAAEDGSEIRGITVAGPDGVSRIAARRGVILASGGFEGSPERQDQYWEGRPVLPAAARHNTGDGIVMSQDVGAELWHMWHFHGAYGFRSPDPGYPYAIRVKRLPDWRPGGGGFMARRDETGEISDAQVRMTWILLDRDGSRYMNEYPPYTHDTGHRQMQLFDTVRQDFPRIPSYLVCDEQGRRLYPLGRPTSNDEGLRMEWSADNLAEVESGILTRAGTLAGLAAGLGLDPATVEASVARWNALCAAGRDEDFGRPPGTMMPVATPPFYGAPVWPVVSNTQGGPVHDRRQRIVDVFGAPIPRLYAAGELGSAFGHLYMSGGNIAECFVSGRIAGAGAAALAGWG